VGNYGEIFGAQRGPCLCAETEIVPKKPAMDDGGLIYQPVPLITPDCLFPR